MAKYEVSIKTQDGGDAVKQAKSKDEVIEALIMYIASTLGDTVEVSVDGKVVYE